MRELATVPFSAEDFRARLKRQSWSEDGFVYGDHRLNPDLHDLFTRNGLRDAAVLIPIVERGRGEAGVILTQRAEQLRSHSGQVSFPGGRIDPTDVSPEDAALRETFEEIGVPASEVEIVGRMPDYLAGSGYRIAPVFGIVRPPLDFVVNEDEVAAVFEVPLGFLMNAANHNRASRVWNERERFYYTMPYGERFIWGVTAGIIRTLYERLYG